MSVRRGGLAILILVATAVSAHAQTKMFKCLIDGRTVYQQSGCPVSLSASEPAPAAAAASQPASAVPRIKKN